MYGETRSSGTSIRCSMKKVNASRPERSYTIEDCGRGVSSARAAALSSSDATARVNRTARYAPNQVVIVNRRTALTTAARRTTGTQEMEQGWCRRLRYAGRPLWVTRFTIEPGTRGCTH